MKKLFCRVIDVEIFLSNWFLTTIPWSLVLRMHYQPRPTREKTPVDEFTGLSSSATQNEYLDELRRQLQSMKKQALVIMEQSRRSSEREKIAQQQTQEAIASKEDAVAEATQATSRENFMLELMTKASLETAGILLKLKLPMLFAYFLSLTDVLSSNRSLFGRRCRRSMG
jgi:hypothetical protein